MQFIEFCIHCAWFVCKQWASKYEKNWSVEWRGGGGLEFANSKLGIWFRFLSGYLKTFKQSLNFRRKNYLDETWPSNTFSNFSLKLYISRVILTKKDTSKMSESGH